jgi:glycosyltransferase involved in cell wall biosynthesis
MYNILYDLFLEMGNEKYIKIRKKFVGDNHIFGIIIATYQRKDGKTPYYLRRALNSVFAQTHSDYMIYIIGDKYEDKKEFSSIISEYPQDKIYSENLSTAVEREKYPNDSEALWCSGGTSATKYGMERALADGILYVCMLDHDDYWLPNHLQILNETLSQTKAHWLCTKTSVGENDKFLPKIVPQKTVSEFLPLPCGIIKSSVCFNVRKIPILVRDVFAETGKRYPGDADLWRRMAEYIKENDLRSYYINTHTCVHDSEGFVRHGGEIVEKKRNNITVITCTGDRPEAFALLQKWMSKQTLSPEQWIVVDDGKTPLQSSEEYEYIRREPTKNDYTHTLCLNFEKALEYVKCDKIIVMEDDDWYSPTYIDYMFQLLDKADLVGLGNLIFYYPSISKYMEKATIKQPAFAQTAFKKDLIPVIRQICEGAPKDFDLCGKGLIDSKLWAHPLDIYRKGRAVQLTTSLKITNGRIIPKGTIFRDPIPAGIIRRVEKRNGAEYIYDNVPTKATKIIVKCDKYLSVGMKGMPGRAGTTTHQNKENRKYKEDINCNLLKSILKSDANYYLELFA